MICSHIFANFARKTLPLASRNISHVVVNKHTWQINKNTKHIDGTIDRFFPNLRLGFKRDDQSKVVTISVDFALFELICNMREGYRPTIQDKNRHADFVSFIQQLIDFGNKSSRITIIPKDGSQSVKMVFEETEFGYEFKVVW